MRVQEEEIEFALQQCEKSSFLILDSSKVKANIELLQSRLPYGGRLMAMVKADGYGQDSIRFTSLLSTLGIDIFGVAHIEEGIRLRQEGFQGDIFVIHALPDHARGIIYWDLQTGVSSLDLIEALEKEAISQGKIAKVHLHINTGMMRFGIDADKALLFGRFIARSPYLKLEGVMTHLASADDEEQDPFTHSQIRMFESAIKTLKEGGIEPCWTHAANSAGLLRHGSQFNMARVGLSIISNAVSLVSKLVHIHECVRGETVGYNRGYRVLKERERIGVVACGYHDGIPRSISEKGMAIIQGKRAPYVGNICMDYMMVDLTDIPDAQNNDEVLLFGSYKGHHIPIELFSQNAGTIAHEIICRISNRVCRVYL